MIRVLQGDNLRETAYASLIFGCRYFEHDAQRLQVWTFEMGRSRAAQNGPADCAGTITFAVFFRSGRALQRNRLRDRSSMAEKGKRNARRRDLVECNLLGGGAHASIGARYR